MSNLQKEVEKEENEILNHILRIREIENSTLSVKDKILRIISMADEGRDKYDSQINQLLSKIEMKGNLILFYKKLVFYIDSTLVNIRNMYFTKCIIWLLAKETASYRMVSEEADYVYYHGKHIQDNSYNDYYILPDELRYKCEYVFLVITNDDELRNTFGKVNHKGQSYYKILAGLYDDIAKAKDYYNSRVDSCDKVDKHIYPYMANTKYLKDGGVYFEFSHLTFKSNKLDPDTNTLYVCYRFTGYCEDENNL